MAGGNPSNILDELAGLQTAIQRACDGVITRPVTVLVNDPDAIWPGPWPLILLRVADYRIDRLFGGHTGTKGQTPKQPSVYSIEIDDVTNPRDTSDGRVASAQNDCYALIGAIVAAFDHVPNRILPDATNVPSAVLAGEHIRFRAVPPFADTGGGDIRIQFKGGISVVGLVHSGSET